MKKKSQNFVNEFVLKIIGYITMTFDHVGLFLASINGQENLAYIFRCIGRIAFPLFVFMIVEGILHTHNVKKYLIRLGILAGILIVFSLGAQIVLQQDLGMSSPLTDLFLIAIAIYLLNRKDKFSFFSILPMSYLVLCFVVKIIETSTSKFLGFFPSALRCDYTIIGLILSLGFYYSNDVGKFILKSKIETENLIGTNYERTCKNILCVLAILFVSLGYYILSKTLPKFFGLMPEEFAIISAIPLLFYNGERGYNKPWFRKFSYLYFPLHLIIIFLVFLLSGAIV